MAFDAVGSRFVTCSLDRTAQFWDSATLKPIGRRWEHHSTSWSRVSFSDDSTQTLVTGGGRQILRDAPPGPIEGNVAHIDLWTQVISGMQLDERGGISVMDAAEWRLRYDRLKALGGSPVPLPLPARAVESSYSRAMRLALRGRRFAQQGQWERALSDFASAIRDSCDNPSLRAKIAQWGWDQLVMDNPDPNDAGALRVFDYLFSFWEGLAKDHPEGEHDECAQMLAARSHAYAIRGQWDKAASDMDAVLRLRPYGTSVRQWYSDWVSTTIVPTDSTWRWLHPTDGADPSTTEQDFHRQFFVPDYDDSHWETGRDSAAPGGGFGYGDPVGVNIGEPPSKKRHAAYFRHTFQTDEAFDLLVIAMQRDDGVIIYLDGVEVARDNMPTKGPEGHQLSASKYTDDELVVWRIGLRGALRPGRHLLAISLHNSNPESSDLRIAGISLAGRRAGSSPPWPDDPQALADRGRAYEQIGLHDKSATDWLHAATAHWSAGDPEKARTAHEQALRVLKNVNQVGDTLNALRNQTESLLQQEP